MPSREIELKYVGKDGTFIPGVPAADHTVTSKKEADRLVESGLYEIVGDSKDEDAKAEAKSEAKSESKPDQGKE